MSSAPSRSLLISHFVKDFTITLCFTVPLHKTVTRWSCASKIIDAVCDHSFSCFRNDHFCRYSNPFFLHSTSKSSHFATFLLRYLFFPNFCSFSFRLFHVPFSELVVYQNAFCLSYYHVVLHAISHLIWHLQYTKISVYKHSVSKSIIKKLTVTACHWTISARNDETVSLPPTRRHLIITIVPTVNMRVLVSLNVILMHLQPIKCRRLLYSIFHENKVSYGLENTVSSLLLWCIILIFLFL